MQISAVSLCTYKSRDLHTALPSVKKIAYSIKQIIHKINTKKPNNITKKNFSQVIHETFRNLINYAQ